jgi:hypothetical protein
VDARTGAILLDTIRRSLGLHLGEVRFVTSDGEHLWLVEAVSNSGERWIAKHPDYGGAALALAELVGFDVIDG